MKRFVYNQKYAKLLVSMTGETTQIDELARRVDANAGHLRTVLEQWHKEGIIDKDKPGRDYQIKLTKKGEAITMKLAELMDLDENWKEPEGPTDPETTEEIEKKKEYDQLISEGLSDSEARGTVWPEKKSKVKGGSKK